jgi:hypothetical protein
MIFGFSPNSSMPQGMTYIVQRKDRFYVVAYDGLDPLTGKERRRWHPVGHDRDETESVSARIDRDRAYINPAIGDVPLRRLRADHLDCGEGPSTLCRPSSTRSNCGSSIGTTTPSPSCGTTQLTKSSPKSVEVAPP